MLPVAASPPLERVTLLETQRSTFAIMRHSLSLELEGMKSRLEWVRSISERALTEIAHVQEYKLCTK